MRTIPYRNDDGYEVKYDPTINLTLECTIRHTEEGRFCRTQQSVVYVRCPESNELTPIKRCATCNLLGRFGDKSLKCRSNAESVPDAWDGQRIRTKKIIFQNEFLKLKTMAENTKIKDLQNKLQAMLTTFHNAMYEGYLKPTNVEGITSDMLTTNLEGVENVKITVSKGGLFSIHIQGKIEENNPFAKLNAMRLEAEMNAKYDEYLEKANELEKQKEENKLAEEDEQ